MPVRFASFNVEKLFTQPKAALNQMTAALGRPIQNAYAEFKPRVS